MLELSAQDIEDEDLTKYIKIGSRKVNINKVGSYEIKTEVKDSKGAKTKKTFKITVEE